jgi:hypothetical protein
MSQVSFASTAANFNDGDTMELRFKSSGSATAYVYKAGLWLKLKFLRKAEIPFRVATRRAVTGNAYLSDARFLWDAGAWSNPTVYFQINGQKSNTTASTIGLVDHANSDTGTTSPTTPLNIVALTPPSTYGVLRSNALTLTNMNRYFVYHVSASNTNHIMGGAFVIIQATE